MRRIVMTITGFVIALSAHAQQDAAFTQYFFNLLYINPAYAGTREVFSGTIVHRSQWVGMDGAPVTQSLSMHSALPHTNIGVGLQAYNDQAGPIKNTGIAATYAYRINLNDLKISFGLSGSVSSLRISGNEIHIEDQTDMAFSTSSSSAIVPDANFGIYAYKRRFFAGASVTHLLQTKFNIDDIAGSTRSAKYYRNYFLTAGLVARISDGVNFRPSILAKYVQSAPVVVEADGCFIFHEKLFVGAGIRSSKRVNIDGIDNVLVGVVELEFLHGLRVGYSYDAFLNQGSAYNTGTHEFMLGWDLWNNKTKMENPLFF